MNKRTVLKSIELFFKKHTEDKPKDPEIKDNTKKSILKVIDKEENLEDRTTDTTFPNPSEPIMSDKNSSNLKEEDFKTMKTDYSIKDLTKKEDIKSTEAQPPFEDEVNINTILNNLDKKLNENKYNHVLNILTTRSSKENFRESALLEYSVYDKSYVVSLIVEKEENDYKCTLKSSYGKEIYSKNTSLNELNKAIYYPFEAIALRDKFRPVIKEAAFVGLNERQRSYLKTLSKKPGIVDTLKEGLEESEVVYEKLRELQSNQYWTNNEVLEVLQENSK